MSEFQKYHSTGNVEAKKLEEDEQVITANGPVDAKAGQYVVKDKNGATTVMDAEPFEDSYETRGSSQSAGKQKGLLGGDK